MMKKGEHRVEEYKFNSEKYAKDYFSNYRVHGGYNENINKQNKYKRVYISSSPFLFV
ncbi:hypothetical protein [Testudinibacter aquarius]|uniref:Uncharacterized protein n=1 Tax=Testudinibacter aquarius TaxID=1524974 RepID=A0A4R3YEN6_9PAST|nr:hypothetical protein [Testudinibacter aquarius]TCV89334.1 hypothetical protein EDC16_102211 [Testudinibacter aquarius]